MGALVIHLEPYYLNLSSNLGNSVIPVVVNLLSRYRLHLILLLASLLKPSLYVTYILGYLYHSTLGIGEGMIANGGCCTSIGGKSTSSIAPLSPFELSFSELD